MREILFRGKTPTEDWVYGGVFQCSNKAKYHNIITRDERFVVKKETVGQYIGAIDDQDIKIFPDDIVNFKYNSFTIDAADTTSKQLGVIKVWSQGGAYIGIPNGFSKNKDFTIEFSDMCVSQLKVVGNIHDDKHLLDNPDNTACVIPNGKIYHIPLKDLELYMRQGLSITAISKIYGCERSVIKNIIDDHPKLLDNSEQLEESK